ncbi:hypothetical protein BB561_006181 [Smittium simulii]|uniref:Ribosomal protein S21 n=1 Tax=Smittium simulii TaxID=133385 RepID=A0A2T9Y608_9FUNG|nr:hypothetical protein BB561_006181 [Smittium simulii]
MILKSLNLCSINSKFLARSGNTNFRAFSNSFRIQDSKAPNSGASDSTNINPQPLNNNTLSAHIGQKDFITNILGQAEQPSIPKDRNTEQLNNSIDKKFLGKYNRFSDITRNSMGQSYNQNNYGSQKFMNTPKKQNSDTNSNSIAFNLSLGIDSGRSVAVLGDSPLRAFNNLKNVLNAGNFRKRLFLKRRYEKPFAKRRREASEANARRVKKEVASKVRTVLRMKGWGF